jgi:hypothetical protein
MEIKDSTIVSGKGVFTVASYKKGDIVYTLSGEISSSPTRESIHIGNNRHIYDSVGIFINHSFMPNIYISDINIIALKDIEVNEEIAFNYNDTEMKMAAPFYVDDKLVDGNGNENDNENENENYAS